MRNYGLACLFFLVVLAIAITLACGPPASHLSASCSSAPTASNDSLPQSIVLCPAVADAKDFPDGQVQFIAIGTFQTAPSPALMKAPLWGACQGEGVTTGVTVSRAGLAQCAPGASGAYTVWADGPSLCNIIGACGETCGITGSAKLTCP